jgi:hypothetical protein
VTRYASSTTVEQGKSLAEIERTITRYGAEGFGYGWEGTQAMVQFRVHDRTVRFLITMPSRSDRAFTLTETGRERSESSTLKAWEQAKRQRWRALALVIKAKLEAVESGIVEFDQEFLAHILMPDGRTVGQFAIPEISSILAGAPPHRMLPAGEPQ